MTDEHCLSTPRDPEIEPRLGFSRAALAGITIAAGAGEVAQITQDGSLWWVCQPVVIPEPPIEPRELARRFAETMALWALPLDPTTGSRIKTANRMIRHERTAAAAAAKPATSAPAPTPEHAHATPPLSIPEAGRGRPVSING
jgi:hypothetical protein